MTETLTNIIQALTIPTVIIILAVQAWTISRKLHKAIREPPRGLRANLNPIRTVRRDWNFKINQTANTAVILTFAALAVTSFGYQQENPILTLGGLLAITANVLRFGYIFLRVTIFRNEAQEEQECDTRRSLPPLEPMFWVIPATILMLGTGIPGSWPASSQINTALVWAALTTAPILTIAWAVTTAHLAWDKVRRQKTG